MVGDHLHPRRERVVGLVVEGDGSALAQMVEQRLHRLVEEAGPVLHAGVLAAGGDGDVERVVGRRGAEQLAIGGAEAADRGLVEEDLADRPQDQPLDALPAALAAGVEAADVLDLVAEQVEPNGIGLAGREQVDDAAAHGVLAVLHHRCRCGGSHWLPGTRPASAGPAARRA
jgi:hypothetical protein